VVALPPAVTKISAAEFRQKRLLVGAGQARNCSTLAYHKTITMLRQFTAIVSLLIVTAAYGQNRLTPELLWQLGRVSGLGVSKDGKYVVYSVGIPNVAENKTSRKSYMIPVAGGQPIPVSKPDSLLADKNSSPDGNYILSNKEVKIKKITGSDFYPELAKSNVYIFDNLMYPCG
jgi:hypothetical protein